MTIKVDLGSRETDSHSAGVGDGGLHLQVQAKRELHWEWKGLLKSQTLSLVTYLLQQGHTS